ncbi:hypothetical protein [Planobispora takensis]|uniref:Uncharacterized protein n=1 Tax=Planobispora takensis TaxID=1367882 RepID=A0A8J3STU9_9ACTN|nr:hypothetical protein [Planobispora takensis]GII00422.1 hypothetical protein Pta02_24300 [Planobispora takensis]
MRWRDRYGLRRRRGPKISRFDRDANDADIEALIAFAKSRRGVEFYVEPETFATDTTAVAVADDGEWTRRRVGSPAVIGKVARGLALPVYDVQLTGYPPRMRAYNERRKLEDG